MMVRRGHAAAAREVERALQQAKTINDAAASNKQQAAQIKLALQALHTQSPTLLGATTFFPGRYEKGVVGRAAWASDMTALV